MVKNYSAIADRFKKSLHTINASPHDAYNAYIVTIATIGEIDTLSPTEKMLLISTLEIVLDLYVETTK